MSDNTDMGVQGVGHDESRATSADVGTPAGDARGICSGRARMGASPCCSGLPHEPASDALLSDEESSAYMSALPPRVERAGWRREITAPSGVLVPCSKQCALAHELEAVSRSLTRMPDPLNAPLRLHGR